MEQFERDVQNMTDSEVERLSAEMIAEEWEIGTAMAHKRMTGLEAREIRAKVEFLIAERKRRGTYMAATPYRTRDDNEYRPFCSR